MTPAMQAGVVKRSLLFGAVFTFLFLIIWMQKLGVNPKSKLYFMGNATQFHS